MYRALVIGCGNIGALYDFNNEQVQTHVKALYLDTRFSLSIYDINKAITLKISRKYHCGIIDVIDNDTLGSFDCVCICTSTDTHFSILKMVIEAGVKVIICEKPISYNINELNLIKSIYLNATSKILVNYIRRFQSDYIEMGEMVMKLIETEKLTNISIRYQRGFINNCSHAFDTIEFLTSSTLDLTEIKKHNAIFDHFNNDPTISLQAMWNKININITGLSNICFSHFEIDLFFEYSKICFKNGGQNIEIYKADKSTLFFQPLKIQDQFTREECLKNYMVNVIDNAYQLLHNDDQKDNFLQSVNLNQKMLKYIE